MDIRSSFPLLLLLLCVGCASPIERRQQVQSQLDAPIDCEQAMKQIAELKLERVSGNERLTNNIVTILPTTALYNLLSGEYASRRALASGKLNEQLYMKIMEIETMCEGEEKSTTSETG